nr:anti-virulence regulator CigR family protein [uncultured Halomonas sp.]
MNPTQLITLSVFAALLLNSAALAQPAHAPAHGARDKGHQHESHRAEHYRSDRYRDRRVDLPRINERELRRLLRRYNAPHAVALPPGIQRNLERGKPLPPGIAKRFDGQLASQLPRYPGYEWEHVGTDVVLIEAATRIVVDVLVDALR